MPSGFEEAKKILVFYLEKIDNAWMYTSLSIYLLTIAILPSILQQLIEDIENHSWYNHTREKLYIYPDEKTHHYLWTCQEDWIWF